MKNIAFYISNHGFGHAARCVPILQELLKYPKVKLYVKTAKEQLDFIKTSIGTTGSIAYEILPNDIGLILKENSLDADKPSLVKRLKYFINEWQSLIEKEKEFFSQNKIDIAVADITPWVFKATEEMAIKSVFISNFTWCEIYKELSIDDDIIKAYSDCYKRADLAVIYPLAADIEGYFKNTVKTGFCCRQFDYKKAHHIKNSYSKPLVYVSVGRSVSLNEQIDLEGLDYDFLYTQGLNLSGSNTHMLPTDTPDTQNYILAADYIITKAGWGTVAEAVCAKKPMAVLRREEIAEDRTTLEGLQELGLAVAIEQEALNSKGIKAVLEAMRTMSCNIDEISENKAAQIAKIILT